MLVDCCRDVVQWGVIPANVGIVTWIYPIKFTSVYSLVTTRYAAYFDSLTQYSDKEMALCYINVDKCRINRGNETTERIYVIAIGQAQQWGIKAASTYTWTYPLPLDVVYYADMMGYREDSAGNEYGWIRSISLIAFETYIIDESAICFCVGIAQQWGHKDNSTSIVTFNLSFPTTCFIALVETLNDGTVNSHLRVSGATNVGFSTWDSATNRPYSVQNYWLALGI